MHKIFNILNVFGSPRLSADNQKNQNNDINQLVDNTLNELLTSNEHNAGLIEQIAQIYTGNGLLYFAEKTNNPPIGILSNNSKEKIEHYLAINPQFHVKNAGVLAKKVERKQLNYATFIAILLTIAAFTILISMAQLGHMNLQVFKALNIWTTISILSLGLGLIYFLLWITYGRHSYKAAQSIITPRTQISTLYQNMHEIQMQQPQYSSNIEQINLAIQDAQENIQQAKGNIKYAQIYNQTISTQSTVAQFYKGQAISAIQNAQNDIQTATQAINNLPQNENFQSKLKNPFVKVKDLLETQVQSIKVAN